MQANGHVEIREMADRIQKTCTVTRADVMAVLVALEDVIDGRLGRGEIVKACRSGHFPEIVSEREEVRNWRIRMMWMIS